MISFFIHYNDSFCAIAHNLVLISRRIVVGAQVAPRFLQDIKLKLDSIVLL